MRTLVVALGGLALSACGQRVAVSGCEGVLLFLDGGVCANPCSAEESLELFAVDTPDCRFVEWAGPCGSLRLCRVRNTGEEAVFTRARWPLTLDLQQAVDFSVEVEPTGASCAESCTLSIDAGTSVRLRGVGPIDRRLEWSGDCAGQSDGTCVGEIDRARAVRAVSTPWRLPFTVVVEGDGVVELDGVGSCGPQATCEFEVLRGSTVTARARAGSSAVFAGWSLGACSADVCSVRADVDTLPLGARFGLGHRLRLESTLPAGLTLNQSSVGLPFQQQLATGTRIRMKAQPGVDDVVFRFAGVRCEEPRDIDECEFDLTSDVDGVVEIVRLHQWAVGGWRAQLNSLLPTDAGVFVTTSVHRNMVSTSERLHRLEADGGLTLLNSGLFSSSGLIVIEAPDGRLWLGATVRGYAGLPTIPINWGATTTSVPSRGDGVPQPIFVRLDSTWNIEVVKPVPLMAGDGFDLATAPPLVLSADRFLGAGTGTLDLPGGVASSFRLRWSGAFDLEAAFLDARAGDLAMVGSAPVLVTPVETGATRRIDSCTVADTGGGSMIVAHLAPDGTCLNAVVGSAGLDAGLSLAAYRQPSLVRGLSLEVSWFEPWGRFGRQTRLTALGKWERLVTTTEGAVVDAQGLGLGGFLFARITVQHEAEAVVSSGVVRVRCPANLNGGKSRVVMRFRPDDGVADWATCLRAREGTVSRFEGNSISRSAVPVAAFGGLLFPEQAATPNGDTATFHVGSAELTNESTAAYVMFLTPPLAP